MTLPYGILTVLSLISRKQYLQRTRQERLTRPAHHEVEVKSVSPWLQTKSALSIELKGCKMFQERHYLHSQAQFDSRWTGSMHDISPYVTSQASTCIQAEHLLALRKREQMENAALRKNYRDNGAFTKTQELVELTVTALLETAGSVVAGLQPPEGLKYLVVGCGRTLTMPTEWTSKHKGLLEIWRHGGEFS